MQAKPLAVPHCSPPPRTRSAQPAGSRRQLRALRRHWRPCAVLALALQAALVSVPVEAATREQAGPAPARESSAASPEGAGSGPGTARSGAPAPAGGAGEAAAPATAPGSGNGPATAPPAGPDPETGAAAPAPPGQGDAVAPAKAPPQFESLLPGPGTPPGSSFAVNIGLYVDKTTPGADIDRLRRYGYSTALIEVADRRQQTWFVLAAGEFTSHAAAARERQAIERHLGFGRSLTVVVLPPPKK